MAFHLGLFLLLSNISYHYLPFVIAAVTFVLKSHFLFSHNFAFSGFPYVSRDTTTYPSLGLLLHTSNTCEFLERSEFRNFNS